MTVALTADPILAWAEELLRASVLPDTRTLKQVVLVDEAGICFLTEAPISGRLRARTAFVKEGPKGPLVWKVVDGWPVKLPSHSGPGNQPILWEGDQA